MPRFCQRFAATRLPSLTFPFWWHGVWRASYPLTTIEMENTSGDQHYETLETAPSRPEPEALEYQTYQAEWQGIALEIRHSSRWLCSHGEMVTQHIEIRSEGKVALPVTETGYRSHFMNGADALAEFNNDPVAFVLFWLDEAANDKAWLAKVEAARQYSLF